jgi:hypothetical protein
MVRKERIPMRLSLSSWWSGRLVARTARRARHAERDAVLMALLDEASSIGVHRR